MPNTLYFTLYILVSSIYSIRFYLTLYFLLNSAPLSTNIRLTLYYFIKFTSLYPLKVVNLLFIWVSLISTILR